MTRRVLQIVGSLACGAEGRAVLSIADRLDRAEFDVQVVALSGGTLAAELDRRGVAHTTVARGPRFEWSQWWQLRRAIARQRPDVVHVWPSAGPAGQSAAAMAGVGRVIVARHAPPASEPWYLPLATRQLAARSAMLIVDCSAVADCWSARGWPAAKIRIIAPGVSPAAACHQAKAELLADLGLPAGARLIAVAGRLELRERVKDLIWAADLVKVIRDDLHLLIVGEGPHRARLERYARLCQIRDKVHFLGNAWEPARLMPHLDLVWRASSRPGLPVEVLEAMAAGKPVVAAEAPGMTQLVTHDQTGFLVPIGDRAGLARYANKLLDDSELAGRLAAAARERVASQFNPQVMVDQLAAVYREVSE